MAYGFGMAILDKKLVCRRCKVAPKLVREEGRRDIVQCPRCDVSNDFDKARKLAAQYFSQGAIDSLRDGFARSARGMKNVRYTKGNRKHMSVPAFIFL